MAKKTTSLAGLGGLVYSTDAGRHCPDCAQPLDACVCKQGAAVSADEVLDYLKDKVAKWWLPDAVEFVDDIPHTATGKISKKDLRERFADYRLEG